MADTPISSNVDAQISRLADLPTEKAKKAVDTGPMYRMMENTKIPVSKAEASLWKSRRDAGRAAMKNVVSQWKEAEAYYSLGQDAHRTDASGGEVSGNERSGRNKGRRYSSTENVVYSNVNAIVPATLSKNPQAEVTAFVDELAGQATVYEHLINRLAQMKYAPGFNLKPKLNKCILRAEITNETWALVGYTKKEDSAEQARQDLIKIGEQLAKAENKKTINELEGKLMAIEELVDVLDPAGPFVRTFTGDKVIVDPTSMEDDFSDAKWMMVEVMLPTAYLLAKYAEKDGEGQYKAVYNEKYIINSGDIGEDNTSEMNNVRLITESTTWEKAGFASEESYRKALLSKVWYCFDKVKRRFILIADEKWDWPLWVWDDPYQLPCFFPLKRLAFHSDPIRNRTKGEVSHYLDQQDEINDINSEVHWMRTQLKTKVVFNADYVSKEQVDALMKGVDRQAIAVKGLPEGMKLSDVLMPPPLPNLQYKELFNKDVLYQAIDRIGTANDVIRGAQFKTNTTNEAIGTYNSIQNQRLDEKIDAVEDFAGDIFYDVMFLCVQFMTQEEVAYILGSESQQWVQLPPDELRKQFACTVLGGSTQKPTSAVKKEQALAVDQVMGQFASATPVIVIKILEMLEKAFDDVIVDDEDWAEIRESIQMQLQQGSGAPAPGSNAQSMPGSGPGAGHNGGPAMEEGEVEAADPQAPKDAKEQAELEMAITKMPPEAQKAIKAAEGKGVPRFKAFAQVAKYLQENPLPPEAPPASATVN